MQKSDIEDSSKICEVCGSDCGVSLNYQTNMYLCGRHRKQIYAHGHITNSSPYSMKDKNKIIEHNDYAEIELCNRFGEVVGYAVIDINDINLVKNRKWNLSNHGYAASGAGSQQVLLHRFILNAPKGLYVDHIDRDKLNNRRNNLRLCTNQENNRNRDLCSNNTSGICGVTYDKSKNKWQAQMVINDKNVHLGRYDNFDDAVQARLDAEYKYFADFKPQNRGGLYEKYE